MILSIYLIKELLLLMFIYLLNPKKPMINL